MNKHADTDAHIAGIADQILNDNYNGCSMGDVTEYIYSNGKGDIFDAMLVGVISDDSVVSKAAKYMMAALLQSAAKEIALNIAEQEFNEA